MVMKLGDHGFAFVHTYILSSYHLNCLCIFVYIYLNSYLQSHLIDGKRKGEMEIYVNCFYNGLTGANSHCFEKQPFCKDRMRLLSIKIVLLIYIRTYVNNSCHTCPSTCAHMYMLDLFVTYFLNCNLVN
jgi:hypothetical protein